MKKKILFISHSCALAGGGEDEFERILGHFSKLRDKYEIHGLFPDGSRKLKFIQYCDEWSLYHWGFMPVIYTKFTDYLKYALKYLVQRRQIRKFIKNNNYSLCIINTVVLLWPIMFISKRIKTIVFIREEIFPIRLRMLVYRLVSRYAAYFISNSLTTKMDFIRSTHNENISTIYSSIEFKISASDVDLKTILGSEKYLKLTSAKSFKFINVAQILKIKNQLLILESLLYLKNNGEMNLPIVFFVGKYQPDDNYKRSFIHFMEEHELNQYCVFLGELERQVLYSVLKHVNAGIISSISEGIPLSLVEFYYFRKPVISTKVGGVPEIIRNYENGILIEAKKNDLAVSMLQLMNDDKLCHCLSNEAYKTFLDKFNFEKAMKKTEDIFDSVIN
jgi:glycosyltransferase involved in cell wall biosynthesis